MQRHEISGSAAIMPLEEATRLGITADSADQFDLMRAIKRCDELVDQIRAVQFIHSQNMCRVANYLAAELGTERDAGAPALDWRAQRSVDATRGGNSDVLATKR